MAFSAQTNFIKIKLPNELQIRNKHDFTATTYETCTDPRAWSMDTNLRSQYYLELFDEPSIPTEDGSGESAGSSTAGGTGTASELASSNDVLNRAYNAKSKELEDMEKKLKDVMQKLEGCNKIVDENESLKEKLGKIQAEGGFPDGNELKRLQDLIDKLEKENDELTQKANAYEKQVKELEKEVEKTKMNEKGDLPKSTKFSDDTVSAKVSEKSIGLKPKSSSQSDKEDSVMIDSLRQQSEELEAKVQELNQQLDELENCRCLLAEMKSRNEELLNENRTLREENENLETERDSLESEKNSLESERNSLEVQRDNLVEKSNESVSYDDFDKIACERDSLRDKLCEIEKEFAIFMNMIQDYENLENEVCFLRCELERYDIREGELVERLELAVAMENEFYKLQQQYCVLHKSVEDLESKNQELSKTLKEYKEKSVVQEIPLSTFPVPTPPVPKLSLTPQPSLQISPPDLPTSNVEKVSPESSKIFIESYLSLGDSPLDSHLEDVVQAAKSTLEKVSQELAMDSDFSNHINEIENFSKQLYFSLISLFNMCSNTHDEMHDTENLTITEYLEFSINVVSKLTSNFLLHNPMASIDEQLSDTTTIETQEPEYIDRLIVSDLEAMNSKLLTEITTITNNLLDLELELKLKTEENNVLKDEIRENNLKTTKVQEQVREMEAQHDKSKNYVEILKDNIKDLKTEIKHKNIEIKDLKDKHNELLTKIESLSEETVCHNKNLLDTEKQHSRELFELKEQINELTSANVSHTNEINRLYAQIDEIGCGVLELEREKERNAQLLKLVDEVQGHITKLHPPMSAKECLLADFDENGFAKTVSSLHSSIQELTQQLECESKNNNDLQNRISKIKFELDNACDLKTNLTNSQARLQLYEKTNTEKVLKIENLKNEIKLLSAPADKLQNDNRLLMKLNDGLKTDLCQAKKRIRDLEGAILLNCKTPSFEICCQTDDTLPEEIKNLKGCFEKKIQNMERNHNISIRSLQELHGVQIQNLRKEYEMEINSLTMQPEYLRNENKDSDSEYCTCGKTPRVKPENDKELACLCIKIAQTGIQSLLYDELCYIHEQVYVAALNLQTVCESDNFQFRKQKNQLENRITVIEKDLKKSRHLLQNLKDGQKKKKKCSAQPPPNSRKVSNNNSCSRKNFES